MALAAVVGLFLLRLDVWNWHRLAWVGPLPAGLAHHVAFCLLTAAVMAWLSRGLLGPGR